jgi:2-polyprenyl-3-methyl-5-hydroxy-6-metoxy-1,4-benzoquinol methylase
MFPDNCPSCKLETTQFQKNSYPAFNEKSECTPTNILTCPQCNFEFAYPMPSEKDLQELYQNNRYWGEMVKPLVTTKTLPVPFALANVRWELLVSHLPEWEGEDVIEILDIGAGQGCFGMLANKYLPNHKISYTVVEPDQLMRDSLEQSWGNVNLKIQLSLYDSLDKVKKKYHIVVLSHILEHVTNPVEFLEGIRKFNKLDGLLFIDVPNQDYFFKKNVFPHLLFFSLESLKATIENSGFEITTIGEWGRDRKSTPMNENVFSFLRVLGKVVTRIQRIIPSRILMTYFAWHFGIKKENPMGTWIRAIATSKVRV